MWYCINSCVNAACKQLLTLTTNDKVYFTIVMLFGKELKYMLTVWGDFADDHKHIGYGQKPFLYICDVLHWSS